jgi:hypothetical protein
MMIHLATLIEWVTIGRCPDDQGDAQLLKSAILRLKWHGHFGFPHIRKK